MVTLRRPVVPGTVSLKPNSSRVSPVFGSTSTASPSGSRRSRPSAPVTTCESSFVFESREYDVMYVVPG